MEYSYKIFDGTIRTVELKEYDISKHDVLYHMTGRKNKKSIEASGLLLNKPRYKSMVDTGLLFFSYPIDKDSSDLFRFDEEIHCVIVLDAEQLHKDGYKFYEDFFGSTDASSKRNHVCINRDIPKEYIKKILEF